MKDGLITLEIGGAQRTLKFNMRALETFAEVKNGSAAATSSAVLLIYAGLIGWYYAKQMEPDFNFEDVVEWVEDLVLSDKLDVIQAADRCFSESRAFEYFSKKAGEGTKKKKLPGKRSTPTPGAS